MPLEFDGVNGIIKNSTSDGDVTIKGNDGGSEISLLAFDVSAEGTAVFNSTVTVGSSLLINGTTPTLTIGDAGAEDTKIVFDGNAQDFYIALDDSADDLIIGRGSTVGTSADIQLNADGDIGIATAPNNVDSGRTLHIKGHNSDGANIRLQSTGDTADTDDMVIQKNDTVGFIKLFGGDTFKVFTSGAERLAIDADGVVAITTSGNGDNLQLISTDADANIGPNLRLYRNSGSPADSDSLGMIDFEGRNDNSQDVIYGQIETLTTDVSDGAEDGYMNLSVMLAGTLRSRIEMDSGETVINEASQDLDFRVESNGNANMLFVDGGNNRVGVGCDPSADFHVDSSGGGVIRISRNGTSTSNFMALESDGTNGTVKAIQSLIISTGGSESMRIDSSGNIFVAKTSAATSTVGHELQANGKAVFTRASGTVVIVQRNTDDGELIKFQQDGSLEGNISVSGSTVSYNGFTGSHWSRLADNSKPTILRGTIMDSIDEMCDWYQAVAEVAESTDDEGNVTPAHTVKESIALGDKSVGDAITFTSNGTEYTGTIVKEGDVKHTKCKVSDTADSKKVYGVFSNWDDQDDGLDGDVNDMNIAQVGTYIIRVNKDVTVSAGDLLVSNGDGTAKKQDDDIIRSKTVAKVNSNIKVETYSDGSYTVPCTLHC